MNIRRWGEFETEVRALGSELLLTLDNYPGSALVAGCQRSGTTIVASIINNCDTYGSYKFTRDSELDAALILSGEKHVPPGKYCFQTTYLNEKYTEYFDHEDYKLVWVLRKPVPVIRSMLYNWSRFSLNRLYQGVGRQYLSDVGGCESRFWSKNHVSRVKKACAGYLGKIQQTKKISEKLGNFRMHVINYDDLFNKEKCTIRELFDFLDLEYRERYTEALQGSKLQGGKEPLKNADIEFIESVCGEAYREAMTHLTCT